MNGVGKITHEDGSIYEGNVTNFQEHGQGRSIGADGFTLKGNWLFGKHHGPFTCFMPGSEEELTVYYEHGEIVENDDEDSTDADSGLAEFSFLEFDSEESD